MIKDSGINFQLVLVQVQVPNLRNLLAVIVQYDCNRIVPVCLIFNSDDAKVWHYVSQASERSVS
jgi:hypothetical protein